MGIAKVDIKNFKVSGTC